MTFKKLNTKKTNDTKLRKKMVVFQQIFIESLNYSFAMNLITRSTTLQ